MIPKVLYLFPAEVIEEEIRRIKIHRASEERKRGESASVIKAVDRGFGIEEESLSSLMLTFSYLILQV